MGEEATEEEVGQEDLVREEEAEVESVNCAPTRISVQISRNRDQGLPEYASKGVRKSNPHDATSLYIETIIHTLRHLILAPLVPRALVHYTNFRLSYESQIHTLLAGCQHTRVDICQGRSAACHAPSAIKGINKCTGISFPVGKWM